jgi:hypothetical protein
MSDQLGIDLMFDHSNMENLRSGYDQYLTDIREFVRPQSTQFHGSGPDPQTPTTNTRCYDSTAMWAAEQLASGYMGFLMPSNDRWTDIIIDGDDIPTYEEQVWLDRTSDVLYREWANPESRFTASFQEDFLDLSSFGTSTTLQEYNVRKRGLSFRSYSTADIWIRESADGIVDVCHRRTNYTTRQLYQIFDPSILNRIDQIFSDQGKNERHWEVIHVVQPNTDKLRQSKLSTNKKYASTYILAATKDVLQKGGYDYYPYHHGREKVIAGNVYGESAAFTHLPAIKMVNSMMRVVIKAANKAVDPPVMAPSDGFVVPLSSDPGALWWYDAGMMTPEAVKTMEFRGRIDISDAMVQDTRSQITRGFHVDWLIRNKKNAKQTATEIMDDRDEMLRQLAPTLGRLESEKVDQMVKTSYFLLNKAGRIPPAPESMRRKKLGIRHQSPAARAQFGSRGADVQRYINDLAPLVNLLPTVIDTINPEGLSRYLARVRNVPAAVMNSPEQIAEKKANDEAQAQQQQMIEGAPAMAGALKDVAQAGAIANEG